MTDDELRAIKVRLAKRHDKRNPALTPRDEVQLMAARREARDNRRDIRALIEEVERLRAKWQRAYDRAGTAIQLAESYREKVKRLKATLLTPAASAPLPASP